MKPLTLSISRDEDSEVIVSDLHWGKYGIGKTLPDALTDYLHNLRDYRDALRDYGDTVQERQIADEIDSWLAAQRGNESEE